MGNERAIMGNGSNYMACSNNKYRTQQKSWTPIYSIWYRREVSFSINTNKFSPSWAISTEKSPTEVTYLC